MIKIKNLTFNYPNCELNVLDNVNIEIPKGSFFALLGPNGAGKTTLLRLLCGRFNNFQGSICIDKEFVSKEGLLDSSKYGILLENPGVYLKLSIEEYLSYFAFFYGMGENACLIDGSLRTRLEYFSEKLKLPNLKSRLSTLSLGNLQKVQIIRSIIHNPKLLILDEPVANLDPISREIVWNLIDEWRKKESGTAIVSSHILTEMELEATHYAIIDKGIVLKTGALSENQITGESNEFSIKLENPISKKEIENLFEKSSIKAQIKFCNKNLATIYRDIVK